VKGKKAVALGEETRAQTGREDSSERGGTPQGLAMMPARPQPPQAKTGRVHADAGPRTAAEEKP